jgi:hypothetical protein
MTEPTDQTLRRWLLQRLPPGEAEPLEHRLLADAELAERLREAETDLLDDLVRGQLDGADRAAAMRRFTATARDRMRLRIAAVLARVAGKRASPRHAATTQRRAGSSRRRRTPAIAALAAAGALAFAVIGLRQPPAATVTLMASQQRGAGVTEIAMPRGAATVKLQAEVDAEDVRYAVSIEGAVPFTAHDVAVREAGAYRFVEVTVPAAVLAAGEHRVRVVAERGDREATWEIRTRGE